MLDENTIKGLLKMKGYSFASAGSLLKASKQAISQTIKRKMKSKRLQSGIAGLIDLPYSVVWGKDSSKNGKI